MNITPAHLRALNTADPETWAPLLTRTIADNAIAAVPDFLANILHESGRLHTLRESLNYTVAALTRTWPGRLPPKLAAQYGRVDGPTGTRQADQWWIAEYAYGGRMGNRAPGHGDGWDFRGTGPLQITGHDNLVAFASTIGWTGTLAALAEYLATPAGGAAAAGEFWRAKRCDSLPDTQARRVRVNGGVLGLAEVVALVREVRGALGPNAGAPGPTQPPASPTPPAPHELTADELNARTLEQLKGSR